MSAPSSVLTSELKMCQELLELEPDNKCEYNHMRQVYEPRYNPLALSLLKLWNFTKCFWFDQRLFILCTYMYEYLLIVLLLIFAAIFIIIVSCTTLVLVPLRVSAF